MVDYLIVGAALALAVLFSSGKRCALGAAEAVVARAEVPSLSGKGNAVHAISMPNTTHMHLSCR